jgi:hypothetical protein
MNQKPKAPTAPPDRSRRFNFLGPRAPGALAPEVRDRRQFVPLTRDPSPDPDERRQPQVGGRGSRALSLEPNSYDASARTVEAVLSAGTAVKRYYFTEELEISEQAIDLSRVTGGVCPAARHA